MSSSMILMCLCHGLRDVNLPRLPTVRAACAVVLILLLVGGWEGWCPSSSVCRRFVCGGVGFRQLATQDWKLVLLVL